MFVQPATAPARALARVTLIGTAAPVAEEEREGYAAAHLSEHGPGIGVDAMSGSDEFWRLDVEQVFHVGGLGTGSDAETIDAEAYSGAEADSLQDVAERIVASFNNGREDEVARIGAAAAGVKVSQVLAAELIWVDRLGCYVSVTTADSVEGLRVPFQSECIDERDCKSKLTMMAQVAWESEKNYVPEIPLIMTNPPQPTADDEA